MKTDDNKIIEFMYQETLIEFMVNPLNQNVMVNATEMAKVFDKQIDNFKRLEGTQNFIAALLESENSKFVPSDVREQLVEKDLIYATNKATFMHRKLAIYFALWLDVKFQVWVVDVIDEIVFGNYKKHWEAHARQETAKEAIELIEEQMKLNPTKENVDKFFELRDEIKVAGKEKAIAIKNQLKLF